MKIILITLVLALMSMASMAQQTAERKVPNVIKESLRKQYPLAKSVKWDKELENYEASFKNGKQNQSVLFDASGVVLETEMEIPEGNLPAAAREYFTAHFKDKTIRKVTKITDVKGVIFYEVEIKGAELLFDVTGKFMKANKEMNEND